MDGKRLPALFFLPVLFSLFPGVNALGQCFEKRPGAVCGDRRICVSGSASAREGWYDPWSCLPRNTVCKALSQVADEFVGGNASTEPAPGRPKIEIASALRVPSRRDCAKWNIPKSHCRTNGERGGASGSHHSRCNAADFFVPGHGRRSTQQRLANLMGSRIGYAGRNVYCSGRAHLSVSTREYFYSSCVSPQRSPASRVRGDRRSR